MFDLPICRGDIYYIDKFGGQFGSEQHSGRPGVIVSNNVNNDRSETVEVVYLTTKPKKKLPTHVKVMSTGRESTVICEQVTTVSVMRIGKYIGRCTDEELQAISEAIVISPALKDCVPEEVPTQETTETEIITDTAHVAALRAELGAYKEMCKQMLDRLAGKNVGGVG